ncbi:MAG: cytochrome c-type biosis protein CcmI [Pseudomonadota bacterium]
MTMFWFLAVAMMALALLIVLPARLRPRADEQLRIGGGASQPNLVILREQLVQLEAQHSAGALDPQQYALARGDIERRVLDEESAVERPTRAGRARTSAVWLGLGVPILALALYLRVGSPDAVLAPDLAAIEGGTVTQAQIEAMVEQLARRLAQPPAGEQPDPQAWEMLARSYASLQRFADADRAYARAIELAPKNAQLLADRADVLAMLQGQRADGEPTRLIEQALAIDPNNLKALALAGTAALERKDAAAAVRYWSRARELAPPGSDFAAGLDRSLEVARAGLPAAASVPAAAVTVAAASASVRGVVSLAPALAGRVEPGDTVFIYARAAQGPRMPLAIIKRKASELPISFTLDDSTAMAGDMKLSATPQLLVMARVSRSGQAMAQAGDLMGQLGPVSPGATGLALTIDSVQP